MVKPSPIEMLREVPPGYLSHYVIDASVALKWVWEEEHADRARRYARGALEETMRISVPGLFWYEVANALRYGGGGQDGASAYDAPWRLFQGIPLHTINFAMEAFPQMCELAVRQGITLYDAAYVFLARSLQVPLITADAELARRCSNLPFVWDLRSMAP